MINVVNSLVIPDYYEDKNHYLTGNKFVANERTSDVTISTDIANNAMVLKCNKFSGKFYNDAFRWKKDLLIATGHIEVDIDTIMV